MKESRYVYGWPALLAFAFIALSVFAGPRVIVPQLPTPVRALAEGREHLVFLLWGASAQRKGAFIDRSRHCVIESPHPSPLSAFRGFFGSRPFSRANAYLVAHGVAPIAWLPS